jgi:hypothetical protein
MSVPTVPNSIHTSQSSRTTNVPADPGVIYARRHLALRLANGVDGVGGVDPKTM